MEEGRMYVHCLQPKARVHNDIHQYRLRERPAEWPSIFRNDPCRMDSTARPDMQPGAATKPTAHGGALHPTAPTRSEVNVNWPAFWPLG